MDLNLIGSIRIDADTSRGADEAISDLKKIQAEQKRTEKATEKLGDSFSESLKEAAGAVERLSQKTQRGSTTLRKSVEAIERRADPLKRAVQNYERDVLRLDEAQRKGLRTDKDVAKTKALLAQRVDRLKSANMGATASTNSLTGSLQRLARTAAAVGASLGVAFITQDAVRVAAGFQEQMSGVAAITGAVGAQFDSLNEKARELGANTRFTAREAASGMEFLARAGFDTNEVLAAIDGNLKLAAAGALDLGRAADITSNILSGFNEAAGESNRVADVLAEAAASANTNVEQLGEAMKFVAPIASGLGQSIEVSTAAIGALSDAGLQAELAGTGLRRVLTGLAAPSKEFEKRLGGLSLESDGLITVLDQLAGQTIGVSEAIEEFGQRGGPAFQVLISNVGKVRQLTGELENAEGAADRIAGVMTDNLAGAAREARSALEDLFIQVGQTGALDGLETVMRDVAAAFRSEDFRETAKSIGQGIGGALKALADNWGTITTATEAATKALVIYVGFSLATKIATVANLASAWTKVGAATRGAAAASALLTGANVASATTGVAAMSAQMAGLARTTRAAGLALVGVSALSLAKATAQVTGLTAAWRVLTAVVAANPIGFTIAAIVGSLILFGDQLDGTKAKIRSFDRALQDAFDDAGTKIPEGLQDGLDKSKEALERFERNYNDILERLRKNAAAELTELRRLENEAAARGATSFGGTTGFGGVGASVHREAQLQAEATRLAAEREVARVQRANRERFAEQFGSFVGLSKEEVEEAKRILTGRSGIAGAFDQVNEKIKSAREAMTGFADHVRQSFDNSDEINKFKARLEGLQERIEEAGDFSLEEARGEFQKLINQFDSLDRAAQRGAEASFEAFLNKIGLVGKESETAAGQLSKLNAELKDQQTLLDAANISEEQLRLASKILDIQRQYPLLAEETATAKAKEALALEAGQRAAEARYEAEKKTADAAKQAAEDAARDLDRERQRMAGDFADVFVDVWHSFTDEGRSAIDIIKDEFRRAFDNVLANVARNFFYSLLSGGSPAGVVGGSPLSQLASLGVSGVAGPLSSGGNITSNAAAAAGQVILGGSPFSAGGVALPAGGSNAAATAAGLVGPLGAIKQTFQGFQRSLANLGVNVGKTFGLGGQGQALVGKGFAGAGTGFAVSQGVNLLGSLLGFGNKGNTGSTIGGTIGGTLGSIIPGVGTVLGSVVGSTLGKLFGALVGGKPSNKVGQIVIDPTTGRVLGTGTKDQSAESLQNLEISKAVGENISSGVGSVLDIIGGELRNRASTAFRDDLINVAAGSRDGIQIGNQGVGGTIANRQNFENTEAGAAAAVEAGIKLALTGADIKGGNKDLAALAQALAAADAPIEDIVETLGSLKSVLDFDAAPVSEFRQALDTVADAFDRARAGAGQLTGSLSGLAAQERKAIQAVGSAFDRSIERQLLELTSPLEAAAQELVKQQTARLQDAKDINAALKAAGDSNEAAAQARLAAVSELNSAEWQQFVQEASESPEAFKAAAEALQALSDKSGEFGVSAGALAASLESARQSLASELDKSLDRQLLELEKPQVAAALDLIQAQGDRFEQVRAVSKDAADEQDRLSKAVALNTAEWKAFVEAATGTPEALAAAAEALQRYADQIAELGADPTLLVRQVEDARQQLAGDFNTQVAQQLLQATNPALAQFNALLEQQQLRVQTAQTLGANVAGVERLNNAERRNFLTGLSDDDKVKLGDALGLIEDFGGRIAVVGFELSQALQSDIDAIAEHAAAEREAAEEFRQIREGIGASLDSIRRRFSPETPAEQLRAAQGEFQSTLQAFLGGDTEAGRRLGQLGEDTIQLASEVLGTGSQFAPIFENITSGLEAAKAAGLSFEEAANARAAAAEASEGTLQNILAALDNQAPALDYLRDQNALLGEGNELVKALTTELVALQEAQLESNANALARLFNFNTGNTSDLAGGDVSALMAAIQRETELRQQAQIETLLRAPAPSISTPDLTNDQQASTALAVQQIANDNRSAQSTQISVLSEAIRDQARATTRMETEITLLRRRFDKYFQQQESQAV